jgi:nickel-dependent lactate racemase
LVEQYTIPFGGGHLTFDRPFAWKESQMDIAHQNHDVEPLAQSTIQEKLLGFAEQVRQQHSPGRPIVGVFTDATRRSPDQLLLEPVIGVLQSTGAPIKLICAIGMHRPSTMTEKIDKLGQWLVDNVDVIDHDPAGVVQMGTVDNVPVEVNPDVLDAIVIGVGVVEPHQYAGYSGGAKTVVIGCGGPNTIRTTHGPQLLNLPGTRLGNIEGNPFQQFVRAAGRKIGMDWAINVITNHDGEILFLEAGDPIAVHDRLLEQGRGVFEVPVSNAPYDVVIAGVGAPKDANLYQASRAATYVGLSAKPVVRPGGVIMVPAPMPEGAGLGKGEQNSFDVLQRFGPTQRLIDYLEENGCRPGEQRALMIAQLAQQYHLIFVGAENPVMVQQAGLRTAPDMQQAAEVAKELTGQPSPKVLIVPHAIQMLLVPA